MQRQWWLYSIFVYTGIVVLGVVLTVLFDSVVVVTNAFDVTPTVDTTQEASRSIQSEVYRFGSSTDDSVEYSDGTVIPSRTFSIQRLNQTTGEWETIGYTNTHLHKVKVDSTDELDISIGHTDRVNTKVK